jgi:hypothetical protein
MERSDIAERMLVAASRHPPRGKADLVEAMLAELQELKTGRLTWALGGLCAIARWRIGEDWLFLIALAIIAPWSGFVVFLPMMFLPSHLFVGHQDEVRAWFLIGSSLVCLLLAVVRPIYWRWVGIGVPLACNLQGYLTVQSMVRQHGGHLGRFTIMDASPVVGLAAAVGVGFLGASIGQLVSREIRSVRMSARSA